MKSKESDYLESNLEGGQFSGHACWYVIHTNARQEDRANNNLQTLGIETFLPRFRESCYNPYTKEVTYKNKPLFPRYLFARFELSNLIHKINFTRGVSSIVNFGGKFASVADEVINLIQLRIDKGGFVRLNDELKPGDEVIVKDGALKDFAGIFEREMKDPDRAMILLKTVSYQAHVVIQRDLIKKVEHDTVATPAIAGRA